MTGLLPDVVSLLRGRWASPGRCRRKQVADESLSVSHSFHGQQSWSPKGCFRFRLASVPQALPRAVGTRTQHLPLHAKGRLAHSLLREGHSCHGRVIINKS